MTTLCAFCLSNGRKLSRIDGKYWNVINTCLTKEDEKLERDTVLQICWECSAKLRNFHLFISTSQQCVRVLTNYLLCPTQTPPTTISNLQRTYIEIIDSDPKHEEIETVELSETPNVKLELEPEIPEVGICTKNMKLEDCEPAEDHETYNFINDDEEISNDDARDDIIDDVKISNDDAKGDIIDETFTEELPEQVTSEVVPVFIEGTTKPKRKYKPKPEPKCTVQWVSTEQAQAWYTSEREQERTANPEHIFLCGSCHRGFGDEQELQKHTTLCHSEAAGNYKCIMCQYRFMEQNLLKSHIDSHFLLYKCKKCSYETRTMSLIQAHCKTEHEEPKPKYKGRPRKCRACKNDFPSMAAFREHRAECTGYKCPKCGKIYKNRNSYKSHVERHNPKPYNEEDAPYCASCNHRFKNLADYKNHMKSLKHVSRDIYRFECDHCGMKYPNRTRLINHVGSVHLKKARFQCELCPKSYNARKHIDRHRATQHQLGEDKYLNRTCHMCGKTFTSDHLLQNHIRTHTGEKPFQCEFCPKSFAQTGTLYAHCKQVHKKKVSTSKLKISRGEKFEDIELQKQACEECGKEFLLPIQLRDHINYVHKGCSNYICTYCNKMFSTASSLLTHNKKIHGAGPSHKRNNASTVNKMFSTAAGLGVENKNTDGAGSSHKRNNPSIPNKDLIQKCHACDATFRHPAALYMHYKMKHLKLKRNDPVRIKNLGKLDKEIIVLRPNGPNDMRFTRCSDNQ